MTRPPLQNNEIVPYITPGQYNLWGSGLEGVHDVANCLCAGAEKFIIFILVTTCKPAFRVGLGVNLPGA